MFLKRIDKKDRKGNNKYVQYRLCESYRINNKTRHRSIINVGRLDDLKDTELKALADRIEQILKGQLNIFEDHAIHIEKYAQEIVKKIIESNATDLIGRHDERIIEEKDYIVVDANSIENHDPKEIGAEWIVKQTIDKLGIEEFLISLGFDSKSIKIAQLNWISRTINPLSELGTEKWLKRKSSLCELLNLDSRKINRFQLYEASRKLYKKKEEIEKYISDKTNELFDINDRVILFDLTNSYFEGRMESSKKAKFGRSKEKRTDAKIMALALVTNTHGFVKYSKMYQGNIADCQTLQTTIEELEKNLVSNGSRPLIVMDAGIATEKNLLMLKGKGYDYLCVSRTALKDYEFEKTSPVIICDKNKKPIELRKTIQDKNDDNYLYVKSEAKQIKQTSIQTKLSDRFEQGLKAIKESLEKKRGIKTVQKVYERIGRLKSKYPRVSNSFIIKTEKDKDLVKKISWIIKEPEKEEKGIYFIRTNILNPSEKVMWDIYNTIREIESTFRCLKTELSIRPNYHQKDENIEPHIHLGILAYQIVSVIRYQLKSMGMKDSWSTLLSKMTTQKVTTTAMMKKDGEKIFVRNCTIPGSELLEIYQKLKLKPVPFYKKRCVPPTNQ